ncbi:YslB family protein [Bacillaceae bacterium Marseille-Q3522]|nr:YslB family protein [Bacillaceae bacterium Marseille-Q3522]
MTKQIPENLYTDNMIPVFGYELLRDVLLPDLLGKEAPVLLYWAGKRIARQYPLENFSEILSFFEKAGWGQLSVIHEKKDTLELELTSPLISERIKNQKEINFQLEAGFLAQQIESQKNVISETFEHPKYHHNKVRFTVKWDKKDFITD